MSEIIIQTSSMGSKDFGELRIGEVFVKNGETFIKTGTLQCPGIGNHPVLNAIRLSGYLERNFSDNTRVITPKRAFLTLEAATWDYRDL